MQVSWAVMAVHSGQQLPWHTRVPVSVHVSVITLHTPSQNWHMGWTVHAPQLGKLAQYSAVVKAETRIG